MKTEENKEKIENNNSKIKLEYDDISPFTGNKCVLIEADSSNDVESRICMESGYTTSDKFTVGSPEILVYEQMIPQLYKDTKFVDQTINQVWYLSTMRTPLGCLYADGQTKDDFVWKLAKVEVLTPEERKEFPVEDKEGEYHTHRIDIDNAEEFPKNDFKAAIDKFYELLGQSNEN
tara:strand:- start:3648 stop:4175 length:528 start_codon:yes stop_codon:yes gene_type:complete